MTDARQTSRWPGVPEGRRRIMEANRRRDTSPELAIRSLLHARGFRYRIDRPVSVAGARPIRPDIVFPATRIAVFIDGCFWHGCPVHGTSPRTNAAYWLPKIHENRERDARHNAALESEGWLVIRAWEHEAPEEVVAHIAETVQRRMESTRPARPGDARHKQ
jgi:DNA mismatch endonuclease (patch repair protein)